MNEKLNKALEQISDRHIAEAAIPRKKRKLWIPLTAAAAAIALVIGFLWWPGGQFLRPPVQIWHPTTTAAPWQPGKPVLTGLMASAEYPTMAPYPAQDQLNGMAVYTAWRDSQKAQYNQPEGYADSLESFFSRSIPEFLSGEGNQVYSPVNVYMALSMLAETTGGSTRQELLALLGADSIEALRTQAGHVWNAHYSADGMTELTMSNSMWIDEGFPLRQSTADILASNYYASSYQGDLQSKDMNKSLQYWLNEQTRGLLKDAVETTEFKPQTVFALASTMYFSAKWGNRFLEENNTQGIFTGSQGRQDAVFMNRDLWSSTYYWGENFSAVQLALTGENSMWIILPDEGVTVQQVLESGEYLRMTLDPRSWKNQKTCLLHLSIPKFDVSEQSDLIPGLQSMGVTEIFGGGDFSPLTDMENLSVSDITHAARVLIDEEGVEAAAFTVMLNAGGAPPAGDEVTFTADRSFLFTVSSRDNLPLFAGVVDRPV